MPEDSRYGVVELRQYTLHPGQRDTLIELFDRELVEPQEAVGMHVIGQFRDLDDPDRFVWLRGFADMDSRLKGLTGFYGGPVWAAHRNAANATMIDSDDVLLLRPDSPFLPPQTPRPPVDSVLTPQSRVAITVCPLPAPDDGDFAQFFREAIVPALDACGGSPVAALRTEHSRNTFPKLPVREGENVFVWISTFDSASDYAEYAERLQKSDLPVQLRDRLADAPQELRLQPTSRSRLR
ncbi:NIPSNAP family protein [Amycolatopsis taiwanensis]|uniref:NIPSNAP family containing protein n=1 Tax=Amycolatopsis taiwanensis TaxID=342230 RepID=A0A9W6VEB6_9PSEU|nr:NIPSNAP family protein [Amycolatopsis taiwanensis]GLY63624.1 NIPSNAP family containing protein [Amycolatopsis taiwanensis]